MIQRLRLGLRAAFVLLVAGFAGAGVAQPLGDRTAFDACMARQAPEAADRVALFELPLACGAEAFAVTPFCWAEGAGAEAETCAFESLRLWRIQLDAVQRTAEAEGRWPADALFVGAGLGDGPLAQSFEDSLLREGRARCYEVETPAEQLLCEAEVLWRAVMRHYAIDILSPLPAPPCRDVPDGAARACLAEFDGACLDAHGGGAGYRGCLWQAAEASDRAVVLQATQLGAEMGPETGMWDVAEESFARELSAYRAARDARCDRDALVLYQSGTAGGGHMARCRLAADILRLREIDAIPEGAFFDTWPEWP